LAVKIRIPDPIARAWDAWGDWANVPVYRRVRRIDVILAIGFIGCTGWYGFTSGWRGALLGGVMYLAVMAMALWLL
jgi:hypothetical protein